MKQLPPTETLTIDGNQYRIADMSVEVQQLVEFYDDWRQREQEIISDLNMVRGAQRDLQQQLLTRVQQELEAAAATAEPEAPAIPVPAKRSRARK